MYYVLRNVDVDPLREGEDYPMTFAVDDDVYTLHFKYLSAGKTNASRKSGLSVALIQFRGSLRRGVLGKVRSFRMVL